MKIKFLQPVVLLAITALVSFACSSSVPSDEIIKKDWNEFLNLHKKDYCVSFSNFEIIDKKFDKKKGEAAVSISGRWTGQADSIRSSGPCNGFTNMQGVEQTVTLKMVYEMQGSGWVFLGLQPK